MNKYRVFYKKLGDPMTLTKNREVPAMDEEDAKRVVKLQFAQNGIQIKIISTICVHDSHYVRPVMRGYHG